MKERPILFSAPMVRAILAGTKTQTRRIVKLPDEPTIRGGWERSHVGGAGVYHTDGSATVEEPCVWNRTTGKTIVCPYGQPGDRLWCKEAIRKMEPPDMQHEDGTPIVYSQYVADNAWTVADAWPWKHGVLPGMFMPRGLSRITLEVTGVRVERLHAITEDDARAEGVEPTVLTRKVYPSKHAADVVTERYRDSFELLWVHINGAASWISNPWVWVVEFKRIEQAAKDAA